MGTPQSPGCATRHHKSHSTINKCGQTVPLSYYGDRNQEKSTSVTNGGLGERPNGTRSMLDLDRDPVNILLGMELERWYHATQSKPRLLWSLQTGLWSGERESPHRQQRKIHQIWRDGGVKKAKLHLTHELPLLPEVNIVGPERQKLWCYYPEKTDRWK